MSEVQRHKTALFRSELSKPMRLVLEDGLLNKEMTVFDYGCGRGGDLAFLKHKGIKAHGWDPKYQPDNPKTPAQVVNLGYVLNVIENPEERVTTLQSAWALAQTLLIVAAQHVMSDTLKSAKPFKDGCLTQRGTFQKFYEQQELKLFIEQHLGAPSVSVAPGIFYVFRDESLRETFLSNRYRRKAALPKQKISDVLFAKYPDLFQALMAFYEERGRLPESLELPEAEAILNTIGSFKKSFGIIKRVTNEEQWEQIRWERAQDLMVYLALARFERRPAFSKLPLPLQYDVKAHFSSYKNACELADDLLYSVGEPDIRHLAFKACKVGKMLPDALYIHTSALPFLPPELRVLEGCARAYIGRVDNANIIKIHRYKAKISYMNYPDFDKVAHPALHSSLLVHLRKFYEQFRDYSHSQNPPILHRKEEFVPPDYPHRKKFEKLTKQEEKSGLYANPSHIGLRQGWEMLLAEKGVVIQGHRVSKKDSPT